MGGRKRLFRSGGSRAVRLPKDYRFDDDADVRIYRQGNRILLEAARRRWSDGFLKLAGAAAEFPYPDNPPAAEAVRDLD
jgi:virulence-associated protein VagC